MSIKTLVVMSAVVAGTFGIADRADAQWRSYAGYNYNYTYSPSVYPSNYTYQGGFTYPGTYTYPGTFTYRNAYMNPGVYVNPGFNYNSGVVTSSYGFTPYTTGYYNPLYSGYSNGYGDRRRWWR